MWKFPAVVPKQTRPWATQGEEVFAPIVSEASGAVFQTIRPARASMQ